jgi:hypothetical protein
MNAVDGKEARDKGREILVFDRKRNKSAEPRRHLPAHLEQYGHLYKDIKKGLSMSNYRLFRFPNGSMSNGYHWNGSGSYTADGIWVSDSATFKPGLYGHDPATAGLR